MGLSKVNIHKDGIDFVKNICFIIKLVLYDVWKTSKKNVIKLIQTYSTTTITPDSASTATAMFSGVKTASWTLGSSSLKKK